MGERISAEGLPLSFGMGSPGAQTGQKTCPKEKIPDNMFLCHSDPGVKYLIVELLYH